jgi:hypothetical protein
VSCPGFWVLLVCYSLIKLTSAKKKFTAAGGVCHSLVLGCGAVGLFSINYFRNILNKLLSQKKKKVYKKKERMLQNRLFLRCLACLALFGAVRTIHAEVVKGEGDAQSWRLRVFR